MIPGFEGLEQAFKCEYGHYPWDYWEKAAVAAGVPKELANLGRSVVREAFQHGWDPWLLPHCGWNRVGLPLAEHPNGQTMIQMALRLPKEAERRWDILMRTDGMRGEHSKDFKEWRCGHLEPDARALIALLEGAQDS